MHTLQNLADLETPTDVTAQAPNRRETKKRYESPRLVALGDVRDMTLGPTLGLGESGYPEDHRVT